MRYEPETQLDLLAPHDPDAHFIIRRNRRCRNMAITVSAHGVVEVVVPRGARPAQVEAFVTQHRQWIDRALGDLQEQHPTIDKSMPDSIALPVIDSRWAVEYDSQRLVEKDGTVFVPAWRSDRPRCREHLQHWLKKKARQVLTPQLHTLAGQRGFSFKKVQVRGQRTRWGSYSSSGTLSLNYCLLFLQPELVEHLMLHELCHTREMNHSDRFWKLLAAQQPQYRQMEKRLDVAWTDVPGWVGLH